LGDGHVLFSAYAGFVHAGVKKIQVLVIDDHAGMRDGICAVINAQPDMEVVGEADNGEDAVLEFKRTKPDVSLVDYNLPVMCGADVIAAIRQEMPAARCLVITALNDDQSITRALRAGALGYLHKDVLRRELLPAIRSVYKGQQYLSQDIAQRLNKLVDRTDRSSAEN
jgi:DNA-binding NarL/FixJ family response regulator